MKIMSTVVGKTEWQCSICDSMQYIAFTASEYRHKCYCGAEYIDGYLDGMSEVNKRLLEERGNED